MPDRTAAGVEVRGGRVPRRQARHDWKFRCVCGAPADDISFDRSICACGMAHYYCNQCGTQTEPCDDEATPNRFNGQSSDAETPHEAALDALGIDRESYQRGVDELVKRNESLAAQMPDPGSFGGHPYTPDEIALGYGTDHDPRFTKPLDPPERHGSVEVGPHPFVRMGWRWWLCHHCYAPRSLHPRLGWVKARPFGDHVYLSADAPHFKEGW